MNVVNPGTRRIVLFLLAQFAFSPSILLADVVVLRSGFRFYDVRAEPFADSHRIWLSNGSVRIVRNSEIRSVRPGPITWGKSTRPTRPDEQTRPNEPSLHPQQNEQTRPIRPVEPAPQKTIEPGPRPSTDRDRPGQEQTARPVDPPVDPRKSPSGSKWLPILESAILPGWGQYSLGRERAGAVYAVSSILVLQQYWTYRQLHAAAERDYNDPVPVGAVAAQTTTGSLTILDAAAINYVYLAQKERRVHSLERQGNSMVLLYALVWGWNMLDVTYAGAPWENRWFRSSASETQVVPGLYIQKDSITAMVLAYL